MRAFLVAAAAASIITLSIPGNLAAQGRSSARQLQDRGQAAIPRCGRNLGTISIVEPDDQWWLRYNLQSPESVLKVFIQRSGCFSLVNRGRSLQSRAMERALADQGELQEGSNVGRGQVRTADYFIQPDIVSTNNNSGGGGLGSVLGGVGGLLGRNVGNLAGSINVKKGEASVVLSVVNARTTVEEAITDGYARKSDIGFSGGGAFWGGGDWASAGASGYQNTEIGQIIVLAYLDAYIKLVDQLGGLPANASAAAPQGH